MVTIYRGQDLQVVIFVGDYGPADVHISGDRHAKTNLAGPSGETSALPTG